MKRRIIKGQGGISVEQPDLQEFTQDDFNALREYYRQQELTNPRLKTNFDRSMEWLDEFRRDHSFVSPETKESFDNALRYIGYVINPIADPIGTLGNYIVNQGWLPEWARNFIPYVDLGVSLGMGRPPIHKGIKAMGKNVSSQRGQYRGTDEAWKLEAENVTGRKYRKDGYVVGSDAKNPSNDVFTNTAESPKISVEEARATWGKKEKPVATEAQETPKTQKPKGPRRGRPTKEEAAERAAQEALLFEKGPGVSPATSRSVAKKRISKWIDYKMNKHQEYVDQINALDKKRYVAEITEINDKIFKLRRDFNAIRSKLIGMGHDVTLTDEVRRALMSKSTGKKKKK